MIGLFSIGVAVSCGSVAAQAYKVTNIVSDGSVAATTIDPGFINPWGVSSSGTWWISTQGTGSNYVVPATGLIAFKVVVPAASGVPTATGLPAGSVTTAGAVGMLLANGTKASFLFSTLDGTIAGWNNKLGTAGAISLVPINNSAAGASYPGLALLNVVTGGVTSASYILAPNFGAGNAVEVYDSTFAKTKLAGTFTDPNLPAGYSPYSIHVLGGQVYVAYALRTANPPYDTVDALGNGVVDVYDNAGNFVSRIAAGGVLDSPWGIAFAPANFGIFSNDLLIGNFGNGLINVFDPKTFAFLGQLMDGTGKALVYASLWDLLTGGTAVGGTAAVSGGDPNTVYFTAGLTGEQHGLFANIANTTTAGATPTFGFSASSGSATVTAGSSTQATISVAPVNAFAGTVTLSCSGLPTGASCSFSPASLPVTATAPAIGTVTISTTKAVGALQAPQIRGRGPAAITVAMLLPFASLLIFKRRRSLTSGTLRLVCALVVSLAAGTFITGCGDYTPAALPGTPAGSSTVFITAFSGGISQQQSFALTVK